MGKRADSSHTILEVEHIRVAIICGIHLLHSRISIQHRLSCFNTVIFYQFAGNTNPLAALECTQFCFRVGMQLLGNCCDKLSSIILPLYYAKRLWIIAQSRY